MKSLLLLGLAIVAGVLTGCAVVPAYPGGPYAYYGPAPVYVVPSFGVYYRHRGWR